MFVGVMALFFMAFVAPAVAQAYCRYVRRPHPRGRGIPLFHQCLCVLLACIMLLGPGWFQQAAQADIQYHGAAVALSDWATPGSRA